MLYYFYFVCTPAGPDAGPPIHSGCASVTRFVCVNCTATGHLSSRWLLLNWAGVRRHIHASKACFAADLGFKVIHVDARAGDVMAGAGGAAGPAPDVCHQPPGKAIYIYCNYCHFYITLVAWWLGQLAGMHRIVGLIPGVRNFYFLCFMFIET